MSAQLVNYFPNCNFSEFCCHFHLATLMIMYGAYVLLKQKRCPICQEGLVGEGVETPVSLFWPPWRGWLDLPTVVHQCIFHRSQQLTQSCYIKKFDVIYHYTSVPLSSTFICISYCKACCDRFARAVFCLIFIKNDCWLSVLSPSGRQIVGEYIIP